MKELKLVQLIMSWFGLLLQFMSIMVTLVKIEWISMVKPYNLNSILFKLSNMCLISKHWDSTEDEKMPWFWAFILVIWRWTIIVCGAFERNVGFTNKLLLGSFILKKFKQRTRICYNKFKSFVWGYIYICTWRIHIWDKKKLVESRVQWP